MKITIDVSKFINDLQSFGASKDLVTIVKSLFFDCMANKEEPQIEKVEPMPTPTPIPTLGRMVIEEKQPLVVDGGGAAEPEVVKPIPKSPLAKKLSAFIIPGELSSMGAPKVDRA